MKVFLQLLVVGLGWALPALALENPAEDLFIDYGPSNEPGLLLVVIVSRLLMLVGIVAMLFIVWGGYQYLASGTSEEMAEKGKKTLKHSVLGLIIVLLSYIIITVVVNTLNKGL